MTKNWPKFGEMTPSVNDWPASVSVLATPGSLVDDLVDLLDDLRGPLDGRRVRQLHRDQQVAFVLVGKITRRQPH